MTNRTCLNCNKELTDKYCPGCGQKADTHRISFKHFILHDVLHGTFHIEKGILFTAKESLIRPGKAALDYIAGKRQRYYNVFYLILMTFGLILFVRHFYHELVISQGGVFAPEPADLNEASKKVDAIFDERSKILILLFVPFSALNSFIVFRRKKLNLSEHYIIAGMTLLGMLLYSLIGNILFYFNLIIPFSDSFADAFGIFFPAIIIFHIGYGYVNAFASDYSKLGIGYRTLLCYVLLALEIVILFYIVVGFITDWQYGRITFSPFS